VSAGSAHPDEFLFQPFQFRLDLAGEGLPVGLRDHDLNNI
jgi:hypothetical protein